MVGGSTESTVITETSTAFPWIAVMIATLIVLGLLVAIMPAITRMKNAKNAIYAITDRRLLMISGNSVQSYGERDIQFIERKMHKDGTGDITFRRETQTRTGYYGGSVFAPQSHTTSVGFFGVEDPQEVEALMLETFRPDGAQKRKHDENWDEDDEYFYDGEEDRSASGGV